MFNDSRRGKSSNFQLVKQAFSPVAGPLTLKRGVEGVLEWSKRELTSKLHCEIHTQRDGDEAKNKFDQRKQSYILCRFGSRALCLTKNTLLSRLTTFSWVREKMNCVCVRLHVFRVQNRGGKKHHSAVEVFTSSVVSIFPQLWNHYSATWAVS